MKYLTCVLISLILLGCVEGFSVAADDDTLIEPDWRFGIQNYQRQKITLYLISRGNDAQRKVVLGPGEEDSWSTSRYRAVKIYTEGPGGKLTSFQIPVSGGQVYQIQYRDGKWILAATR